MATEKTYTPTWKCSEGVVTRNGTTWTAKWKVPGDAVNTTRYGNKVFTGIELEWRLQATEKDPLGKKRRLDSGKTDILNGGSSSSGSIELKGFPGFTAGKKVSRGQLHPDTADRFLVKILFRVRGFHDVPKDKERDEDGNEHYKHGKFAGKRYYGPWTGWASWTATDPADPVVTLKYVNGSAVTTVKSTDDTSGRRERRWTSVYVRLKRKGASKWTYLHDGAKVKETDRTFTDNIKATYLKDLEEGKTVTVQARATAKGFGGNGFADGGTPDGNSSKMKWQQVVIGIPTRAVIGSVTRQNTKISVNIKSVGKPVHRVELQRRHGANGSWESVSGAVDDQKPDKVTALYDTWGAVWPNGQVKGEHVYYRIKSTCFEYENFSNAFRADVLYEALPAKTSMATCYVGNAKPDATGTAADVTMAWTDSPSNGNDGCELSWSDNPKAWASTEPPQTAEFAGDGSKSSGVYTSADVRSLAERYRTVNIANLTAGTTYYVKMRRYKDYDGEKRYSAYSNVMSFTATASAGDGCGIVSAQSAADGTRATVVVGIKSGDTSTGTEITWSDYSGAWQSNKAPESLDATWGTEASSGTWARTQTSYLADLKPNTRYYVRARRFTDGSGSRAYGAYSKVFTFLTSDPSTSSDVRCGLVSVEDDGTGTSATAVIGFSGDHTGCEVSWSDNPNAWDATDGPSTDEFETSDAVRKSTAWSGTATRHITALEQGKTYYVKARCYYEDAEGSRSWSPYTAAIAVTPFAAPDEVTATAPDFVRRGEPIDVYWTVSGELEQTSWRIMAEGEDGVALASGTGSLCHGVIPPEAYASAASLAFHVESSVGGGYTESQQVAVSIADVPSCEVSAAPVLAAQPVRFEACTGAAGTTLLVTLRSEGVTVHDPDGDRDQLEGEVVWTSAVEPTWADSTWGETTLRAGLQSAVSDAQSALSAAQAAQSEAQAAVDGMQPGDEGYDEAAEALEYATAAVSSAQSALADAQAALDAHPSDGAVLTAEVELPTGLALYDGARYALSVKAVEPVGGLASEEAAARFSVAWAHQAPVPNASISVAVDEDARTATVTLAPPDGAAEGDSYELYRKTPTGYDLAASALPLSCTVTDRYAPFGAEQDYLVACRTADGDLDYLTFPYSLPVKALRFDWPGGSVELPWNLELSNSYEKTFEARPHMDGAVNGYFERAVVKQGSYSTAVHRVDTLEMMNAIAELGEHAGAVFCRTQFGAAFQCNADVRSLETSYQSKAVPASIDVTAVDLTDLYRLGDGDVEVPQNG